MTEIESGPLLWHGGTDGLQVGDDIVPAVELARLPERYALGPELYPCNPRLVYVTSDRDIGLGYASNRRRPGGGSLYRVTTDGPLEPDPDVETPGLCWRTPRAVIVAVEARSVHVSSWLMSRLHAKLFTWPDSSPIYDARGRILPSPTMRAQGLTRERLATMGCWVPFELVLPDLEAGYVPSAEEVESLVAVDDARMDAVYEQGSKRAR